MENALSNLVECLQTALSILEGSENACLKTALHDHSKLPDKLLAQKAAKAVNLLHRTEQLLEPGPLVLADHFLGYVNTKCLCAAVEFNIPDLLEKGPRTADDLAQSSHARADRLRQVLRVLHSNGIFSYDEGMDMYSNNSTSLLLLRGHWTQWRNWVDLYGNEFYDMAKGIPASCHSNAVRTPAQINYDTDQSMFTYFQEQGWTGRLHRTLSGGAVAQGLGIAEDYPWEELGGLTFLDIGGGSGGLVALALRRHKSLQAGILDLPNVIEQASKNFHSPKGEYVDVGHRVAKENLIVGDFLVDVPEFECYTMKWCLHDWKDSSVLKILANIRRSITNGPRSRLVIFESLLEEGRMGRLSRYADITMMNSANGQERNEAQWRKLAKDSGWLVKEIYHLRNAWPCAIELVPEWDIPYQSSQVNGTQAEEHNAPEEIDTVNGGHVPNGIPVTGNIELSTNGLRPINGSANDEKLDTVEDQIIPYEAISKRPQGSASVAAVDNPIDINVNKVIEPERVQTKMTFLEPWDKMTKGNPYYRSMATEGFDSTNISWQDHLVVVTDARPSKYSFSLDKNAFQYIDDPWDLGQELMNAIRNGDRDNVERLYYPHVEEMIKAQTGAHRVIIFDHTLRKRRPALQASENPDGKEQPATIVHCDQSEKGALRRLKQNLNEDDDYDEILKGRVQMINIWRPIAGPVVDWPLAQMDCSSLSPENAHACDLWRGEFEERGQTMTFEYGDEQKWYYLKEHRVDEVTLVKIWDSADVGGKCCPHAAFAHPATPLDAPPRESVEVRCLVLYPPSVE